MGYPSGIQTFTTKQDGVDYPQASHINLPQTEITAIETGLLSGFQHPITVAVGGITQSASTGSNNFAGPSTFAGDVVVSGTLTVGGSDVNGRRPGVQVVNSADQAIANGAWVGLAWDTQLYDSTGLHSTASNSSRINLTSSGLWLIGGQVNWRTTSTGGDRYVRVRRDDSTSIGGVVGYGSITAGSTVIVQQVSAMYYATDTTAYITLQVFQNSGSTGSVSALPGSTITDFGRTGLWAQKVSN